jgi:nitrite reductase/ring-hydroxylating ferredoxin subunit
VLDGNTVTCPWHGAQFNVKTGKAVGNAKIAFINVRVKDVASYLVKVEGTTILVEIP